MDRIIQAHAIEADEALHSSMEEEECGAGNLVSTHRAFCSLPALPAQPSTASSQYSTEEMIRPAHGPPPRCHNRGNLGQHTLLAKAKSTPLLLNQIFEERESDLEDSPTASPRVERNRKPTGGGLIKTKRNTRRLSPVPSTGSRRSSSCSSSDDDELDKHMRRLKTSQAQAGCKKPSSRRGSHDDGGSEGDDGAGSAGGGRLSGGRGLARANTGSTNLSNKGTLTKGERSYQQGNGGKKNCLNVNGFVDKHGLASIDESNKENINGFFSSDANSSAGESGEEHGGRKRVPLIDSDKRTDDTSAFIKENQLDSNYVLQTKSSSEVNGEELIPGSGKRSPLIEECEKSNKDYQRTSSFLLHERKSSASKYIHHCTCEDKRTLGTCKGHVTSTDLENIAMSMRNADVEAAGSGRQNLRMLKNPSIVNISSTCCQIF